MKNIVIDKTLTYASETWILTKKDRKQINIFERKVYRRIFSPEYNEKEKWRILTNKEIYAMIKRPTITETIRLNRLRCFVHVQRMKWWFLLKPRKNMTNKPIFKTPGRTQFGSLWFGIRIFFLWQADSWSAENLPRLRPPDYIRYLYGQ